MTERLSVNILVSQKFDLSSTPIIIDELRSRGHIPTAVSEDDPVEPDTLLDCDVYIDRSSIVDLNFFQELAEAVRVRRLADKRVPLLVDEPTATINSMDKRRTHEIIPDLIPPSYNLDGVNNEALLANFIDDEFVVIKDPFSWYARGIDRLSPVEAITKYRHAQGLIAQKYIPFAEGVGRALTLNYGSRFELVCAYLRIPNSWRTGEGTVSEFRTVVADRALYDFAQEVSVRSGLYLNGIDYIESSGINVLLEVNAVPGIQTPFYNLGVNSPAILVDHIEKSLELATNS